MSLPWISSLLLVSLITFLSGHQYLCLDSCSSLPTSLFVGTFVLPTTSNSIFHRTHCWQNCPSNFEHVIPLFRVHSTLSSCCLILNCLSDLSDSSHYPSLCFQNSQAGSYLGSFYLIFLLVGMFCSGPFNVASLSSSLESSANLPFSSLRGFPWPILPKLLPSHSPSHHPVSFSSHYLLLPGVTHIVSAHPPCQLHPPQNVSSWA